MKLEKKSYKVELITKMLGTVPKNKEIYATYVATKGLKTPRMRKLKQYKRLRKKAGQGFTETKRGFLFTVI